MGERITPRLCIPCSVYHLKNSSNSGDYNKEGILQSYCPECGEMHPPVSIQTQEFSISRRRRKRVATAIASFYHISHREMNKVTSELILTDDTDFIVSFQVRLNQLFNITIDQAEIGKCLMGSGKIEIKQIGEQP